MERDTKGRRMQRKKSKKLLVGIVIIILIVVMFFIFRKTNSKNNNLIGTWTTDGITIYEFNKDGVGALKVPSSEYVFVYNIDGNKMHIDFRDPVASDSDYEYSVEKEVLTIKGIEQTIGTYTLTKQK